MTKRDALHSLSRPKEIRPATIDDLKPREIFEDVNDAALEGILKYSTICSLDSQKTLHPTIALYPTKQLVSYVYVILSGYVSIWSKSEFNHNEEIFLAWRGPEQIIGEMRSVGAGPTASKIVACEPCKLLEIRNDAFTDLAKSPTPLYRNIGRLLIEKMAHEQCRSEIIRIPSVGRQVAQTLLHLAHERTGHNQINESKQMKIPGILHQAEISGYIGVSRASVSRKLASLRTRNIIAYGKSKNGSAITILNREELKKIAHSQPPPRRRKK